MDFRTIMALAGLAALAGLPAASGEKQLTAREMFYTAPAVAKPQPEATPAKPKPQPKVTKPKPQDTAAQTKSASPEKAETATAEPAKPPRIVPVAYTQRVPLGVRYSVLKRTGAGESLEVDPGSVFRAGDRIRLSVEVNDTAYLYIVNRGSSGAWKVLFPSAEVDSGDNRVERGRRYEIPAGYVFTFDEQPGVEKLFLVLSRQPETDLENLIYSLSQRSGPVPSPGRPPAAAPPEEKPERILLAHNLRPVEDSLIGRLRNAYARDLIIEKVDEATPGPKKEHAVYVVNATGRADSRVVVDIALNHQ